MSLTLDTDLYASAISRHPLLDIIGRGAKPLLEHVRCHRSALLDSFSPLPQFPYFTMEDASGDPW
jgi:hypothetical protein